MGNYNYNFFQIPASGPINSGAVGNQRFRDADAKISTFGALNFGTRSTDDYTIFVKSFKSKDEGQNPAVDEQRPSGRGEWSGAVTNPFAVDSTVKRIRNDELVVMLLGARSANNAKLPLGDVMDTKFSRDTTISGTTVSGATTANTPLYFPKEGYKFFGTRTGGPEGYFI
jgi:hypothetical protein